MLPVHDTYDLEFGGVRVFRMLAFKSAGVRSMITI